MFNFSKLIKKIKKILLSINEIIESFFNVFNKSKRIKKNFFKNIDKRFVLFGFLIILSFLSYLIIPSFYNENKIKLLIEKQIFDKYNINVQLNGKIKYGPFPTPHFTSKNFVINDNNKDELAISKKAKIYISVKDFLFPKKFNIKDLVLNETEFNLNFKNVNFFKDTLNSNKSGHDIIFKNSNLFYKDKNKEVIFLIQIDDLKFSFDNKKLTQKLISNFKIFNTVFDFEIVNDQENKKASSKLKSKMLRLNIKNDFTYNQKNSNGLINVNYSNKKKIFNYNIKTNLLNFYSNDQKIKGEMNFKPFYFFTNLNFYQLNLTNLLKEQSILLELINTQFLYHQNLNAKISLNLKNISNFNYLEDIILNITLEEGKFLLNNSQVNWNESVLIKFNDVQLVSEKNQIKLIGGIDLDFYNSNRFYSYYQIRKNDRITLDKINLNFIFDFNQKKISIDNLKINKSNNKNINMFLNDFNSLNSNIFNKVTFRNFLKDFFENYEG